MKTELSASAPAPVLIAAFYLFAELEDAAALAPELQARAEAAGLVGSMLVASEGVNGTLAGAPSVLRGFLAGLRADRRLAALDWKESWAATPPFRRMKVRLKREIVSMGAVGVVRPETVGAYVPPSDWNALIRDPEVAVVDVRNDYEIALGRFEGSIDPETASFRDFPAWADHAAGLRSARAVAMYCTGGIRCEKATAYARSIGFENVYHLEGGILRYLEEVPEAESLWRGECFVFDERVSVDHTLQRGTHDLCHGCRRPISATDKTSPDYTPGVSCPACVGDLSQQGREARAERMRQIRLAEARGERHLGRRMG